MTAPPSGPQGAGWQPVPPHGHAPGAWRHVSSPQASPDGSVPGADDPLGGASSDDSRPPVRGRRPWIFAVAVLVIAALLAGSWGVYVSQRISEHGESWPAGQPWTDPDQGVTFQVVKVSEVREVQVYSSKKVTAPAGAVYLLWHVKVSGVTQARAKNDDLVICGFNLLGENNALWVMDVTEIPDGSAGTCSDEQFDATGEGTLVLSFLVPESKLGELQGIQLDHAMELQQPPVLVRP